MPTHEVPDSLTESSERRSPIARVSRSQIFRLIIRRLFQVIPVVIGASFVTFAAINLSPKTTVRALLGFDYTKAAYNQLYVQLHFNQPFFERYFVWLGNFVIGRWGTSYTTHVPVITILSQRLSVTVELIVLSFLLTLLVVVPVAVAAAVKPRGVVDRSILVTTMLGLSTPQFVLGLLLILVFSVHLRLLPSDSYVPLGQGLVPNLKSFVLPAVTLSFALVSGYVRVLRADLVDQMQAEDYIVTARAKGISQWGIVSRHALRNALFGLVTVIAVNFGTLVGGAVIIEQVFSLPGMGQELLAAVVGHDVPVALVFDTLIAVAVVVLALVADLIYMLLDPRIRNARADG
jgi:peptide/nickel transport system permease protein